MDYYDYMLGLLMTCDAAFTWYGDDNNISDEELDAIFDAMFGKVEIAHTSINDIIEEYVSTGELPASVENAFGKVQISYHRCCRHTCDGCFCRRCKHI